MSPLIANLKKQISSVRSLAKSELQDKMDIEFGKDNSIFVEKKAWTKAIQTAAAVIAHYKKESVSKDNNALAAWLVERIYNRNGER